MPPTPPARTLPTHPVGPARLVRPTLLVLVTVLLSAALQARAALNTAEAGLAGDADAAAAFPGPPPDQPAAPLLAPLTPLVRQVRDGASDMVLAAMRFIGVPYRRGGASAEGGFDCSGFTRHVFEASLGRLLPRRADQQAGDGSLQTVLRHELRPGDLVFFDTMRRAFSHVGIYVGDGKFIHAPRSGGLVRIEHMDKRYWAERFNGARRADDSAAGPGAPTGSGTPAH